MSWLKHLQNLVPSSWMTTKPGASSARGEEGSSIPSEPVGVPASHAAECDAKADHAARLGPCGGRPELTEVLTIPDGYEGLVAAAHRGRARVLKKIAARARADIERQMAWWERPARPTVLDEARPFPAIDPRVRPMKRVMDVQTMLRLWVYQARHDRIVRALAPHLGLEFILQTLRHPDPVIAASRIAVAMRARGVVACEYSEIVQAEVTAEGAGFVRFWVEVRNEVNP